MDERSTQEPTTQRSASRWSGPWLAGKIVIAFTMTALVSCWCESLSLTEWNRAALVLLVLFLTLAWLVAGFASLWRRGRTRGPWRKLLWATLGVSLVLALGIPWRHGFNEQRALEMLVSRFDPLVHAIERFERERGRPPQALEELVPEFIPEIPQEHVLGNLIRPSYTCAATWSLRADLALGSWLGYPTGELDYRPDQQYVDVPQLPDADPDLEDGRYRGWHWRIVRW